ncbi:thioredoxin family protein [Pedobacter sp. BAL39]|nr:thioredoxin family protein [Pedobacter sp. BAL39]
MVAGMAAVSTTPLMAQDTFQLKGKIKGQSSGMIRLSYSLGEDNYVQDSCLIKNGTFEFKGKLTEPTMAYISGNVKDRGMDDPNSASLFMDPGVMTIELVAGDFKNMKLKGSSANDELKASDQSKANIRQKMAPLLAAYDTANKAYVKAREQKQSEATLEALKEKASDVRDQFEPYYEQMGTIDLAYIKGHPDSYYAASMFVYKVSSMPLDSSKKYYDLFSERIKSSSYGKAAAKEIAALQSGSPGSMARVFSVKDINGAQLSLDDFKGKKYVLLDFWASWCVPCRKGNPHLLSLYSKYKDKGLEIVGISDDDSNHEAWKKAVEKDGIGVWRHVLRGLKVTGHNFDKTNDITEPFGIHSLPTKILIDKEGMIVGRYGGGGEDDEAMDRKLAAIFN